MTMQDGSFSEGVSLMAGFLFALFFSILFAWGGVFLFPGLPQKLSPSVAASSGSWGPINTAVLVGMGLIALTGLFINSVRDALWLLKFYTLGLLCVACIRWIINFLLKRFAPDSNAGQRIAVSTFCASCLFLFFDICYTGHMDPFAPLAFVLSMPVIAPIVCCLEMVRWFWIKMAQACSEKPGE
jgi:hypothetical protein